MSETKEFSLPDDVTEATGTDPRDLVIISQPKMGKSCILGELSKQKNALVLCLEKGGYEYISARKLEIYPEQSTTDLEAFDNYIAIRNLLVREKGKYDILIIDGLSDLDRMSEIGGTKLYMTTTIGKKFNRSGSGAGPAYPPEHPKYKSVLTLPEGAGYKHTRDWFLDQIRLFREIAPYRVYAAHVADKYITDKSKDEVIGQELFLTGKLKNMFAAKVTALGKLIAEGDERHLNFEVLNDSIIAGSRASHLKGKILISEKNDDDSITAHWDSIYKTI